MIIQLICGKLNSQIYYASVLCDLLFLDQLPILGYYANCAAFNLDIHCLLMRISMQNTVKVKMLTRNPKTRNGLVQMIKTDKSTSQKGLRSVLNIFAALNKDCFCKISVN